MYRSTKLLGFRIARFLGAFHLAQRLTSRQLRVIGYHAGCSFDEAEFNPKLFMRRKTFSQRLDWLQHQKFCFLGLDDAVVRLSRGEPLPRRSVVLTFDDGWRTTVRDLLSETAQRDIPTTLYLATNYFDRPYPVVNVALRYLAWKSKRTHVDVPALSDVLPQRLPLGTWDELETLSVTLRPWILADEGIHTMQRLMQVAQWMGVNDVSPEVFEAFRYIDRHDARQLSRLGCSIEMHTYNHTFPVARPDVCLEQLQLNRAVIVTAGLPTPRHFCYPSGNHGGAVRDILAQAEVASATTCEPGLVKAFRSPRDARFIPRFIDGEDVADIEFEAEMSGFTELLRRAALAMNRFNASYLIFVLPTRRAVTVLSGFLAVNVF